MVTTRERLAELEKKLPYAATNCVHLDLFKLARELLNNVDDLICSASTDKAIIEKLKKDEGELMDIVSMQQKQLKIEQQETADLRRKFDIYEEFLD